VISLTCRRTEISGKKLRLVLRIVASGICLFSSFVLSCLLLLNYYYNCSVADCITVHRILTPAYSFTVEFIFPLTKMISLPYMVILFVECVYFFSFSAISFAIFRATKVSMIKALSDGFKFACVILVIFETGIYFIDQGWWNVQVTSFIFYPLSLITNQDLLIISACLLGIVLAFERFPKLLRKGQRFTILP